MTDRRTDGRTDGQNAISISRVNITVQTRDVTYLKVKQARNSELGNLSVCLSVCASVVCCCCSKAAVHTDAGRLLVCLHSPLLTSLCISTRLCVCLVVRLCAAASMKITVGAVQLTSDDTIRYIHRPENSRAAPPGE